MRDRPQLKTRICCLANEPDRTRTLPIEIYSKNIATALNPNQGKLLWFNAIWMTL